jgi:succinate dehydrogenase / fumarate reductase flavoprotein subunit
MANPSWTQIHPTCLPQSGAHQSKLTLMSESLRNDGRIWVPIQKNDTRHPNNIPEEDRDYYLERRYPAFGNLAPRDIASRAAKERIDQGYGVGPLKNAVYLDFHTAMNELGQHTIRERYGNLFSMYEKITDINAYQQPMMISPAAHFSMGRLWVDYELMTNLPGLYALGECNFADHGANRLGANSLLQACIDGYFVLPYTIGNYLYQDIKTGPIPTDTKPFEQAEAQVKEQINHFLRARGSKTADDFHRQLGNILWQYCGLVRNQKGLETALQEVKALQEEFQHDLIVTGDQNSVNAELEKASRVADYLEFGTLICYDALTRNESCGAHFREEYQTRAGEALRNDREFAFVSAWEYQKHGEAILHKEPLVFENVELTARSYK